MTSLTIVIPTYQEATNVVPLLRRLEEAADAIVATTPGLRITAAIVDDSSPDGTAAIARELAAAVTSEHFAVRVETRAQKQGLGAAYLWAFEKFLAEPDAPDFVMQMDADLSHDPEYVAPMLRAALAGADLVVASRYIRGGSTPDWSLRRRFLSVGGNLYTRFFLGSRITDYTGGFNLYSAALLRSVIGTAIETTGYGFQIVLKYRALRRARLVRQVPIVFLDRTDGESKIPSDTLAKNLLLVIQLRLGRAHL